MDAGVVVAIVALAVTTPVSVAALLYSRSSTRTAKGSREVASQALAVNRTQARLTAHSVELADRRQHDEDAPRFVLETDEHPQRCAGPSGSGRMRWGVRARWMEGASTRIRVRWHHQSQVQGSFTPTGSGLQVAVIGLDVGQTEGPLDIVKGDRFGVQVECPDDAVALTSCVISVESEELDARSGEPTGRSWPWAGSASTLWTEPAEAD